MSTALQLTRCPACEAVAEIERRSVLMSTDGPIEHVKVRCVDRHVLLLPAASLAAAREPDPRPARAVDRR